MPTPPPVELILVQDELWARSLSPSGPPKAFRFRTEQIESLRIEDSRLRDHVLLAASLAGLVAGGITVAAVDDPYSPFTDIGASILAFGATFGLAVPIGYLIVGKPGSEVDPPD